MRSENFELKISDNACYNLYYKDKVIVRGCNNIIAFMAELGITTPPIITDLEISEDEEMELEQFLKKAILDRDICINKYKYQ